MTEEIAEKPKSTRAYIFEGPLSLIATQFLKVLRRFENELVTKRAYEMMLGLSDRVVCNIFQELKNKGYIRSEIVKIKGYGNVTHMIAKTILLKKQNGEPIADFDFSISDDIINRLS
jgi:hypothetical protein